jgi:hypothetical protein
VSDQQGTWKLLLSLHYHVQVLVFLTEGAANEAEDFYSKLGWHTVVINDELESDE